MIHHNYTGTFNWHGEIFELFTEARTKARAKTNMFYQLHELVDRPLGIVRRVFNGAQDNFKIVKGALVK